MSPVIEQIIRLSGDLPDPQRHRRYLETLSEEELRARAQALVEDREPIRPVRFWRASTAPQTERVNA